MNLVKWIIACSALTVVLMSAYLGMANPSEKYSPQILGEISFQSGDSIVSAEYANKYEGYYVLALISDAPTPTGQRYDISNLNINIEITLSGNKLVSKNVSSYTFEFWGKNSGVALIEYDVPDDLPLGVPLLFSVRISESSYKSLKDYQLKTLAIVKMSDE